MNDDNLRCPILSTLMKDPVVCSDGNTYEKAAILMWFETCNELSPTSPLTGEKLRSRIVQPNHALRNTIEDYVRANPDKQSEVTSDADLAKFHGYSNNGLMQQDSLPLIDLRTDEEIAAEEQRKREMRLSNQAARDAGFESNSPSQAAKAYIVPAPGEMGPSMVLSCTPGEGSNVRANGRMSVWEDTFSDNDSKKWSKQATFEFPFAGAVSSMAALHRPLADSNGTFVAAGFRSGEIGVLYVRDNASDESSSAWNNRVRLVNSGKETAEAHHAGVTCVASWPGAPSMRQVIVSGSQDATLKIWCALTDPPELDHEVDEKLEPTLASISMYQVNGLEGSFLRRPTSENSFRSDKGIMSRNDSAASATTGNKVSAVATTKDPVHILRKSSTSSSNVSIDWEFEHKGTLTAHTDTITCCDIDLGSGTLVTGGEDWKVCLFDLSSPSADLLQEFEGHSYAVNCAAFSTCSDAHLGKPAQTHSTLIASGGDDETVFVWDPRASRYVARLACGSQVLCCTWGDAAGLTSPVPWLAAGGGTSLASFKDGSENVDGWLRVWEPRMWKTIGDCSQVFTTENTIAGSSSGYTRANGASGVNSFAPSLKIKSSALAMKEILKVRSEGDSDKSRLAHYGAVTAVTTAKQSDGSVVLLSGGTDFAIRTWKLPRGIGTITRPLLAQTMANANTMEVTELFTLPRI